MTEVEFTSVPIYLLICDISDCVHLSRPISNCRTTSFTLLKPWHSLSQISQTFRLQQSLLSRAKWLLITCLMLKVWQGISNDMVADRKESADFLLVTITVYTVGARIIRTTRVFPCKQVLQN